nr:uncharacterized protein LOC123762677 isoform X1 [Procambarus clarkii]XP_045605297.1 uncharacterized protein LOC123762677 isoform X1 [Procambarus clarkii]XP_045605298.1 uncharacterized protein LOC123762677 isoform X1 [Procambarus clarkii]
MDGQVSHDSADHNAITHECQLQKNDSLDHMELTHNIRKDPTDASNEYQSITNSVNVHMQHKPGNENAMDNSYTAEKSSRTHEKNVDVAFHNSESTECHNICSNENLEAEKYLGIKSNWLLDPRSINVKALDVSEDASVKSQEISCMDITLTDDSESVDNKATLCPAVPVPEYINNGSATHLEKSDNTASICSSQHEISETMLDKDITQISKLGSVGDINIPAKDIKEDSEDREGNVISQNQLESENKVSSDQVDCHVIDEESDNNDESDEPSDGLHITKLGKICRVCGEMTVKYDGQKKGVPKHAIVKHVKKIWNVDISDESSDIYPVNVCHSCERRIKRLYPKISKRKKCEMFRHKLADFIEHNENDCAVCLLKERTPSPSRLSCELSQKETGSANEVNKSQGSDIEVNVNSRHQTLLESRRNSAYKRTWEDEGMSFKTVGCQTELDNELESMTGLEEHDYTQDETLGQFRVLPKKLGGRSSYQKQSLISLTAKYIRQDRLKPLIAHIDKFCQLHKEDKIDAMFFLLMQTLRDAGDRSRETLILDVWCKKNNVGMSLTEEECLAKRIMLKQTKDQYRKEYSYYKEKLEKSVLKPPFIIDRLEKTYFPEHLEYFVTDGELGPVVYQHEKSTHPSYFTISDCQDANGKGDNARASVMGVRWRYFDAVAKTLEELSHFLENEIQDINEDACINVDMFDYCEEKRDMTTINDKNDSSGNGRGAQSKMITYFFGVQSMQSLTENTVTSLYKSNPNTVLFRPLMKALVAEGGVLHPAVMAIDEEKDAMTDKVFHITLPSGTPLRFMVSFSNSSLQIRKDCRNVSGLSLSSFKKVPVIFNRYGSICLELKRSWLATSPRLVHVSQVTKSRTKCSRCGEQGHNVRKCSLPSGNTTEDTGVQRKKRKKQRTAPSSSHSTTVGQNAEIRSKDSKRLNMSSHHHHHHHELQQQQQQHHQHQLHQNPHHSQHGSQETLAQLATGATSIDQNSGIIHNNEQILYTCPSLGNTSSHIGNHASQGTQVLMPTHVPSSSAEYQSLPQRPHTQISQGTSTPVYVWAYTVVQPQQGSSQHQPQQLSLVHDQPVQQAVTQHAQQQLSLVHQQTSQQETSPQHQQLSLVHQQSSQQEASPQHQQLSSLIHQQPSQQEASPQHQQLSLVHQQPSQQEASPQHQQLSLVHQQSSQQEASPQHQQLSLIHQQSSQQEASPQHQQLSLVHQQSSQQEASPQHQQLSLVHQQSSQQEASPQLRQLSLVHQQSSQQEASPQHQQLSLIHQQPSQQEASPQHQQLSLVHQQSSQQEASPQHQQLSLVHQQSSQHEASPQQQQLSVAHQQSSQPGTPQPHQQLTNAHQQSGQQSTAQQLVGEILQHIISYNNKVHN